MGEGVQKIDEGAFEGCSSLTEIHLPKKLEIIENGVFYGCKSLSTIELPYGVLTINKYAFRDTSIQSIILPDSVRQIGFQSFDKSQITSIEIPAGVNNISWLGALNLESIIVSETNPYFDSRDNCNAIINTKMNKLIMGCKNTVIPPSVESIDQFAFNRSTIEQITIPETVQTINSWAFDGCVDLKSVTFEGANIEINGELFRDCPSLKTIMVPAKKTKYFMKRIRADHHTAIVEPAPVKKAKAKAKAK